LLCFAKLTRPAGAIIPISLPPHKNSPSIRVPASSKGSVSSVPNRALHRYRRSPSAAAHLGAGRPQAPPPNHGGPRGGGWGGGPAERQRHAFLPLRGPAGSTAGAAACAPPRAVPARPSAPAAPIIVVVLGSLCAGQQQWEFPRHPETEAEARQAAALNRQCRVVTCGGDGPTPRRWRGLSAAATSWADCAAGQHRGPAQPAPPLLVTAGTRWRWRWPAVTSCCDALGAAGALLLATQAAPQQRRSSSPPRCRQ
jgi:hypothetical protein